MLAWFAFLGNNLMDVVREPPICDLMSVGVRPQEVVGWVGSLCWMCWLGLASPF
jgi:hypothetical protein